MVRIGEAIQSVASSPARAVIATFLFAAIWGAVALLWTPTEPASSGSKSAAVPAPMPAGDETRAGIGTSTPLQIQAGPPLLPERRQALNVSPAAPNQLPSPPPRGTEMGGPALLGVDQWPRFREYVFHQNHVSNRYNQPVGVGDVLPGPAEYYDIPPEFGEHGYYRYAIVNDRAVIVDPLTRVVVQVID